MNADRAAHIEYCLEHLDELMADDSVEDWGLTPMRIKTIYAQAKYGHKPLSELAEYYGVSKSVVEDIASGDIFDKIKKNRSGNK